MHFFNDKKLALRFREDAVPEKERFYYLLAFMISFSFVTSTIVTSSLYASINQWDIYSDVFFFLTTIFGTYILYRTNSTGDNKDFIARFICISFPVTIKITLLIFVVLTLTAIADEFIDIGLYEDETSAFDLIVTIIITLIYYLRLNTSMRLASTGK